MRDRFGRVTLGDFVVGIDDKPIEDSADLFRALEKYEVGDVVTLQLMAVDPKVSLHSPCMGGSQVWW